jgi:hypothetical protein
MTMASVGLLVPLAKEHVPLSTLHALEYSYAAALLTANSNSTVLNYLPGKRSFLWLRLATRIQHLATNNELG